MASPPPSSSPPATPLSKQFAHLRASLIPYLTKTNTTLAHLNKLFSNTTTLDTALLTTTYTLQLLASLLAHSPTPTLSAPTPTLLPRLRALTALLDESRILLRLPALLSIYLWGLSTYTAPPQDLVARIIAWTEVLSCAVFQALENLAFLGDKGVVGVSEGGRARAWRWSARAWGVFVGCEIGRLGLEWGNRRGVVGVGGREKKEVGVEGEGLAGEGGGSREKGLDMVYGKGESELREEKMEREEWWRRWKRDVGVNLAYAPMTVHYGTDGFMGEGTIAALGVVVAWMSFGDAWRGCA